MNQFVVPKKINFANDNVSIQGLDNENVTLMKVHSLQDVMSSDRNDIKSYIQHDNKTGKMFPVNPTQKAFICESMVFDDVLYILKKDLFVELSFPESEQSIIDECEKLLAVDGVNCLYIKQDNEKAQLVRKMNEFSFLDGCLNVLLIPTLDVKLTCYASEIERSHSLVIIDFVDGTMICSKVLYPSVVNEPSDNQSTEANEKVGFERFVQ